MIVKNEIRTNTDKVISDTTMMFMACAVYVLHEKNGFGKNRIMQFMADIEQVSRENDYKDIIENLSKNLNIDFPSI